jgi:phosphatidylglycerophosphate synthase
LRAGAVGCLVVVSAAFGVRSLLPVGAGYPWKALVVFAALAVIALRSAAAHPFTRLGPANEVTFVRAMLVGLIAGCLGEPPAWRLAVTVVAASAVAAVLDGVDGWLARRSGMASTFGARFDVETDALLIFVMSALVWRHDKAGPWVLLSGMMRYAFVAAGWLLPWMAGPLTPTRRGKTTAILQVVAFCVALAPMVHPPLSTVVAAGAVAVLTWSFAIDVRRLWRQQQRR